MAKPQGETDSFRLLIVGKTGTGKSETGNTILGKKAFSATPFMKSETPVCQYNFSDHTEYSVEVLDTPGMFDTEMPPDELRLLVLRSVACMNPGPHAVLYVHKVGDRYTKQDADTFMELKRYYGPHVTSHTIIVFTHSDLLTTSNISQQDYLDNTTDSFKQVLAECGNRCVFLDNTAVDPAPQIKVLMDSVRDVLSQNGGRSYKGGALFDTIRREMEQEVSRRLHGRKSTRRGKGKLSSTFKALDSDVPGKFSRSKTVKEIEKWVEREVKTEIVSDTSSEALATLKEAAKYILIGLALAILPPVGMAILMATRHDDDDDKE